MSHGAENPRHLNREPEQSGYLFFDSEELLTANPAGQIINPRSIQQMEGRFDPDLFDTPKVVRVATPEGQLWLVTDGLNRLYYAAGHKADTFPSKPDFSLNPIKVFDATESYLQNPKVVVPTEHPQSLKALTLREYFRAVLPTTAVHTEIAPQRVAAHLIRAWENMVGGKVAKKFSLIAALQHAESQSNDNFIVNQTPEEKAMISRALKEVEALVQENHLKLWEIKRMAFMLVVNRSQIIGGDSKALQEIQGMMYHPEIDRKLKARFPDSGQREIVRSNIGKYVVDMFRSSPQSKYFAPKYLDSIRDVLMDKRLSIDDVGDIFSALDTQKSYEKVLREKNFVLLEEYYKNIHKTENLSEFEAFFIEKFGKVTRIEHDLSVLTSTIQLASSALQEAQVFGTELQQIADTLVKTGVTAELIESSFQTVKKVFDEVQNRRNPNTLKDGINQLKETLTKVRKQIKQQQCLYWTGNIIVEETGVFDTGLAYFLIRQLNLMSQPLGKNEEQVRQVLQQLNNLDDDLRRDVVVGLTRLEAALRLQSQRRPRPIVPRLPQKSEEPSFSVTSVPSVTAPVETMISKIEQNVTLIDRDRAEMQRKEANNQRMARVLQDVEKTISGIDLEPKDYDPRTKNILNNLIKQLGKLAVGHPNILRTHEEWKRNEEEKLKARINTIEEDQEKAYKDTRTKR